MPEPVVVRPHDHLDVRPSDLEPLASELRKALAAAGLDTEVVTDAGEKRDRVRLTFHEVVEIVVPTLSAIQAVAGAAKTWMEQRRKQKNDQRPRRTLVLGPDGRPVVTIELDGEGAEPSEHRHER